ncbi:MAG: ornithine carbamoyltransferase [Thermoplasmata archaeon]|nr:MAG: ornithine carbamoyltransferase [Thermoplasmata archaeon]
MVKHLLSIMDVRDELHEIINLAMELKKAKDIGEPLKGKSLAMIFEKPSTRTRVSFEVAMTQLGGHALYLSPKDLQLGRGETIADTARVLSRYVDAIMYRAFDHKMMVELANNSSVPVINGLDDKEHPCQIVADLVTIKEYKGEFEGKKLAYVGDGNNVCHSLLLGCAIVGMDIAVASPKGYEPEKEYVDLANSIGKQSGANVMVGNSMEEAASGADVLYTDVWVSMGDEAEAEERMRVFKPYQINSEVLSMAKKDAIVMHCLPAHRGLEITDEVIDGEQSAVWDQAENRLHAQKAILLTLLG